MKKEPAFPQENLLYKGLTMRDYFAAQAMQAIITKFPLLQIDESKKVETSVALGAYKYADAMMEVRK
jgi:hypothetical protein